MAIPRVHSLPAALPSTVILSRGPRRAPERLHTLIGCSVAQPAAAQTSETARRIICVRKCERCIMDLHFPPSLWPPISSFREQFTRRMLGVSSWVKGGSRASWPKTQRPQRDRGGCCTPVTANQTATRMGRRLEERFAEARNWFTAVSRSERHRQRRRFPACSRRCESAPRATRR